MGMNPALAGRCQMAPLTPWNRSLFRGFTFPRFAGLLERVPDSSRVLAMGLSVDGQPSGLALLKRTDVVTMELLSVWVEPGHRCRGLGSGLMQECEMEAIRRGIRNLTTRFRTTIPERVAFEALLRREGWDGPSLRMLILEAEFEEIVKSPFMRSPPPLEPDFEILPWHEVGAEEIEHLGREGNFSVEVWPLNFGDNFHRETSLGLRYRGELVGWVVNHPVSPEMIRFTTSYLRDDLQRRGRFAAVQAESVWRLKETPVHRGIWSVPVEFPRMLNFARKRLAPYCYSVSESRGWEKNLTGSGPGR